NARAIAPAAIRCFIVSASNPRQWQSPPPPPQTAPADRLPARLDPDARREIRDGDVNVRWLDVRRGRTRAGLFDRLRPVPGLHDAGAPALGAAMAVTQRVPADPFGSTRVRAGGCARGDCHHLLLPPRPRDDFMETARPAAAA